MDDPEKEKSPSDMDKRGEPRTPKNSGGQAGPNDIEPGKSLTVALDVKPQDPAPVESKPERLRRKARERYYRQKARESGQATPSQESEPKPSEPKKADESPGVDGMASVLLDLPALALEGFQQYRYGRVICPVEPLSKFDTDGQMAKSAGVLLKRLNLSEDSMAAAVVLIGVGGFYGRQIATIYKAGIEYEREARKNGK